MSPGTQAGGPEQFFRAKDGGYFAGMQTPVGPTTAVGCSAGRADQWVAAGDAGGHALLRLAGGEVPTPPGQPQSAPMFLPLYGQSQAITEIASSPNGNYLATASDDGTVRIWDARNGRLIAVLPDGAPVSAVQFGPGGGLALTVDTHGLVRIWDAEAGEPVTELQAPRLGQMVPLGFVDAGRHVFGAGLSLAGGTAPTLSSVAAVFWNAGSGRLERTIPLPGITRASTPCPALPTRVAAFPVMSGGSCNLPPPSHLALAVPLPRPAYGAGYAVVEPLALAVSPDSRYIAYAKARSVTVIGPAGQLAARMPLPRTPDGLSFGPPLDELVAMTDQAIYVWSPRSGRPARVVRLSSAPIDVALSASGSRLAVALASGAVQVWDAETGRIIRSFRPKSGNPGSYYRPTPLRVAISSDGGTVAAGNANGTVVLWDVATRKIIATRSVSTWPIIELDLAAHSRLLAVDLPQAGTGVNPPGTGEVVDMTTGHVLATYQSPAPLQAPVDPGAALSPDGSFLFAGGLGLAPSPPGGIEASYQISTGQTMLEVPNAAQPPISSYSLLPVQPWSPDASRLLAGTVIYACDACGQLTELEAAAASMMAWSKPLSVGSDHPPRTPPYG